MQSKLIGINGKFKRFLVAGGAGFIGSHLVRYLLSQKSTKGVLVIDNFVSGSRRNLAGLEADERLAVLEMDVTDGAVVSKAGDGYDIVMHLAAVANPTDYEKLPVATLRVNSDGSSNLISIAKRSKALYVYFSSSEVYGNYETIPNDTLSEICQSRIILNQKRSPYVVGKCFGEEMTISLCNDAGIGYLIVRPFNVYGPNMDLNTNYGRVIPNFIMWGLKGKPMLIHGEGTQIRSFCHIDDFIEALVMLLNGNLTGNSINIGYPHPISVLDLARLITEVMGTREDFKHVPRYEFEPFMRVPDASLIKKLTGWEPKITLKEGIKDTVEWFKGGGKQFYNR